MAKKKIRDNRLEFIERQLTAYEFDGTLDGIASVIKAPEETEPGVRRRLVDLLRTDESMVKFIECAETLLRRRGASYPSLDLLAAKAGLSTGEVVGAIAKTLHRYSFDFSRIIMASNMSRVAATLSNEAAKPESFSDRALFMRANGHLPTGGHTQVNVLANATAGAQANASVEQPTGLPSFESRMKSNIAAIRTINVLPENG